MGRTSTPIIRQRASQADEPRELLSPSPAAELLGITTRTLHDLNARGLIPVARISARLVRYPRLDVMDYVERLIEAEQKPGSER